MYFLVTEYNSVVSVMAASPVDLHRVHPCPRSVEAGGFGPKSACEQWQLAQELLEDNKPLSRIIVKVEARTYGIKKKVRKSVFTKGISL